MISSSAAPGSTPSTSPFWIGELYFNFGWSGIAIGMFLMGIYFRVLQVLFSSGVPIPAVVAGVVALWATLPNIQGALTGPLNGVPFLMIPIAIALVRVIGGTYEPAEPQAASPKPAASYST